MSVYDLIIAIRRAVEWVDLSYVKIIVILTVFSQDGPKLSTKLEAWDSLMASWLSQDGKGHIVPALVQSQVNKHIFLAEFLCHLWTQ